MIDFLLEQFYGFWFTINSVLYPATAERMVESHVSSCHFPMEYFIRPATVTLKSVSAGEELKLFYMGTTFASQAFVLDFLPVVDDFSSGANPDQDLPGAGIKNEQKTCLSFGDCQFAFAFGWSVAVLPFCFLSQSSAFQLNHHQTTPLQLVLCCYGLSKKKSLLKTAD